MKRIIYLILFLMLFALVGCGSETSTISTTEQSSTTSSTTKTLGELEFSRTVSVIDYADMFEITETTLNLYANSADIDTAYVDIEEFVDLLGDNIIDFEFVKNDHFRLAHSFVTDGGIYRFYIEFRASTNEVFISDFNVLMFLNVEDESIYETDLQLVGAYQSMGNLTRTIDLDDYEIDIIENNEQYYIPLYLANLLLTGNSLNVYLNQDELGVFDDFTLAYEFLSNDSLGEDLDETKLSKTSANFAALLFDHFYGLSSEYELENSKEILEDFGLYDTDSIEAFDKMFMEFVLELDDPHTSVIDYGYFDQEVEAVNPPTNSRLGNISFALYYMGAFEKPYEFSFTEFDDYYYLDIVAFTLDTKDYLAENLVDLDPDKDIYIDVSCNLGGNLVAVLELIAYMTDEPISLRYLNPATNTMTEEVYQLPEGRALENNFVVFSSNATFSAANLFVSMVSDNDLGLVIGRSSSGGGSAVAFAVLPNNLVMTYSTNMNLTDSEYNSIEHGINPDITYGSRDDFELAYNKLNQYFNNNSTFNVINNSGALSLDIGVDIVSISDKIGFNNLKINVYDALDDSLIDSYESGDIVLDYQKAFSQYRDLIDIEVIVSYEIFGYEREELIFSQTLDSMADRFTVDTVEVPVGQTINASRHVWEDEDYIKVVIEEAGVYRIGINNDVNYGNRVYDLAGNEIERGNFFILEPGTYIMELNLPNEIGTYRLKISRMDDDNLYGVDVFLEEGNHQATINIEFEGDREWFNLILEEESEITVSAQSGLTYYIAYPDGTMFNNASDYLRSSESETFILPKGEFILALHYPPVSASFTFNFSVVSVTNDYSGDIYLNDANYGVLVEGENTITFNGAWDQDIYVFETTEPVSVLLDGNDLVRGCLITGEGKDCRYSNEKYDLEAGTHYFMFFTYEDDLELTVYVQFLQDLSSITKMIPIEIGSTFDVIIEEDEDMDYYTFTLTELTTLSITMINGHSSRCYIYLDDGNFESIVEFNYGDKIFQLSPGNYILAVGENISNFDTVEVFEVTIEILESADSDPNVEGLPEESYRVVNLPADVTVHFTGEIDYEGDWDMFWLNITEAGIYQISYFSTRDLEVYVIIDGEWNRVRSNRSIELEEGSYYVLVRQYSDQTTTDYTVMFFKD